MKWGLAVVAALAIARLSWPVCLLAAVALAGWWLTRGGTHVLARTTAWFLSAAATGLVALCLLMAIAAALRRTADPYWLRNLDRGMVQLHLRMQDLHSLAVVLPALLATMLMSYFAPRLEMMGRVSRARRHLAWLYVALTSSMSFTFFSSIPLQRAADAEWAETRIRGDTAIARYEVALRKEWRAASEYLAANLVGERLRQLTPEEKGEVQNFLEDVQRVLVELEAEPFTEKVADHLAELRADAPAGADTLADTLIRELVGGRLRAAKAWLAPTPATISEWRAGETLVAAIEDGASGEKRAVEVVEGRALEVKTGLAEILAEVVAHNIPKEMGRFAVAFLAALVGDYAPEIVEELLKEAKLSPGRAEPGELLGRSRDIPRERLPTWQSLKSLVPAEAMATAGSREGGLAAQSWVESEVSRVCRCQRAETEPSPAERPGPVLGEQPFGSRLPRLEPKRTPLPHERYPTRGARRTTPLPKPRR